MKYLFVCLALVGLTACTDAQRAKYTSIGSAHHIQLYSGGKLIGEWDSTGAVTNEEQEWVRFRGCEDPREHGSRRSGHHYPGVNQDYLFLN
jgi:hypothetical protein